MIGLRSCCPASPMRQGTKPALHLLHVHVQSVPPRPAASRLRRTLVGVTWSWGASNAILLRAERRVNAGWLGYGDMELTSGGTSLSMDAKGVAAKPHADDQRWVQDAPVIMPRS